MIVKELGGIYKLHAGDDPLGMMGMTVLDGSMSINRGRMSAKGSFTRQNPDRIRDVMIATGGIVDDHKKNPTVHIQHDRGTPVGRASDPLGTYTVKMCGDGLGWEGETYFSQHTKQGEDTFRLVETKVLCGMSAGFFPILGQVEKAHGGGNVYKKWKLVEYSHVVIPEHQDCLVEAVYKGFGGKPLCKELDAILRPMCPTQPAMVVGGWDAEAIGKAGTYKTAESKELTPLSRESEYFVCPHCSAEITRRHLHEDDDGTIRHGQCRGPVTFMKPPEVPTNDNPTVVGETHIGPTIGTIPKSLTNLPPRGWRQKMYDDYPTDQGDPNAVDPNAPPVADTEGAWLTIASDMLQQAMDGDDSALKRLKVLVDTKRKLSDSGVSSDMPNFDDADDDGDSADDDTDADGEQDGPPKKKAKSLMVFRPEDAAILTKGYKIASAILVAKSLNRDKLDPALREWLDELETVSPVKASIVTKSIKPRHKPITEPAADAVSEEWAAYWKDQSTPIN